MASQRQHGFDRNAVLALAAEEIRTSLNFFLRARLPGTDCMGLP
jgi:hypothetical protein